MSVGLRVSLEVGEVPVNNDGIFAGQVVAELSIVEYNV